jgi:uncharacterized alkaline shock family protein YloU
MVEKPAFVGKTTIAPDVLLNIARLTVLSVPGVSRLSPVPASVDQIFRPASVEGVRINVEDNTVYADIYVVLVKDMNIRDVSRTIQSSVARAISEMVGMDVGRVNIHIDDIDYDEDIES